MRVEPNNVGNTTEKIQLNAQAFSLGRNARNTVNIWPLLSFPVIVSNGRFSLFVSPTVSTMKISGNKFVKRFSDLSTHAIAIIICVPGSTLYFFL